MCGKFQTIFLTVSNINEYTGVLMNAHLQPPGVEKLEDLEDQKGGAQVRLLLWLGLEQFQSEWAKEAIGGNVAVYAETVRGVANCSCPIINPFFPTSMRTKHALSNGVLLV